MHFTKESMKPRMSYKNYECSECGATKSKQTNHFGEIYPYCSYCRKQTVWKMTDSVPEGAWIPEPWKMVRLGDICEIKTIKNRV